MNKEIEKVNASLYYYNKFIMKRYLGTIYSFIIVLLTIFFSIYC